MRDGKKENKLWTTAEGENKDDGIKNTRRQEQREQKRDKKNKEKNKIVAKNSIET